MVYCIAVIVVLPQIALLLLYTPQVQQTMTQWGLAWLSERTGMEVRIEKMRIQFPLRIEMQGIRFGKLVTIGKVSTNLHLYPLKEGTIASSHLEAAEISIRTDSSTESTKTGLDLTAKRLRIEDITYRWKEHTAAIGNILIADGYTEIVQQTRHTSKDPLPPKLPLSLTVDELNLQHIEADYTHPQTSVKMSAENIAVQRLTVDTTLHIALQQSKIEGSTLILELSDKRPWTFTELNVMTGAMLYNTEGFEGDFTHLAFDGSNNIALREGMTTIAWRKGEISLPRFSFRTPNSTLQGHLHKLDYSTKDLIINAELDAHIGRADALPLMESIGSLPNSLKDLYPTETLRISATVNGSLEQLQIKRCHLSLPTAFDFYLSGSLHHTTHSQQREALLQWSGTTYNLDFIKASIATEQIVIPFGIATQGTFLYTPDTIHAQCSLALQEGMAELEGSYRPIDRTYTVKLKTDSLNVRQILPEEELGLVSVQADLSGKMIGYREEDFRAHGKLHLNTLQWRNHTFSNTSAQIAITDSTLYAQAQCQDSLMQWDLTTCASILSDGLYAELEASVTQLDLQALQMAKTNLHPTLQCHATLSIDSAQTYTLHGKFSHIVLSSPEGDIRPRPISIEAQLKDETILMNLHAGGIASPSFNIGDISLTAHYAAGALLAQLHTVALDWQTPQIRVQGRASGTFTCDKTFTPDHLSGVLHLTDTHCHIPTYNLELHTSDTLSIPIDRGILTLNALPLYAYGGQPLLLGGKIVLSKGQPTLQLQLSANDVNLLQPQATNKTLLYGKAFISGNVGIYGQPNDLTIDGALQLRPGTSLHYIYKDAILTASNTMESAVTFIDFSTDSTSTMLPSKKLSSNSPTINISLTISPTAELEVSLGQSKQNDIALQGGGTLYLQHSPTNGLQLAGRYTIENGDLTMNIPLLHVSHMRIYPGSSVTWSGNPKNPLLNISAEERIRASVTLNGSPESVLFVTGISLTDTMEKLGIQFTLSAPENASMQNTLAALSNDERSKLAVALLTTGLYLGEGGTGNLMNTALMSLLQTQFDDISHNTFRTIDVSIGIDPLFDGVSGVSTRTDYTFSLAKRLWNDRIRISIGGSVTANNQRIESNGVIDNITIEWRITPIGSQYLRFFYDKHYESILEGEIRETGIGYVYRKQF